MAVGLPDEQVTLIARSGDGLVFEEEQRLSIGSVPELSLADGVLRLYVCSEGGIVAHASPDDGRTWEREARVTEVGCDPSRVAGTDLFVYKTFTPGARPGGAPAGGPPPGGPPGPSPQP